MELINWLLDIREKNKDLLKDDPTIKDLIEIHLKNLALQPSNETWLNELTKAKFCLKHISPVILSFSVSRIQS